MTLASDNTELSGQGSGGLGVRAHASDMKLSGAVLYPNPAHELIFIESENELDLIVTNKLGQVVDNRRIAEGNNTIPVSDWEVGLYFFQFSDDKAVWTERVVVE